MSSIKINDGQIKVERYSETTALLGVMGRSAEMNAEELRTVAFACLQVATEIDGLNVDVFRHFKRTDPATNVCACGHEESFHRETRHKACCWETCLPLSSV